MLSNAYLLAKIGADTAENEQRFAEILPTDALCPPARPGLRGHPVAMIAAVVIAIAVVVAVAAVVAAAWIV